MGAVRQLLEEVRVVVFEVLQGLEAPALEVAHQVRQRLRQLATLPRALDRLLLCRKVLQAPVAVDRVLAAAVVVLRVTNRPRHARVSIDLSLL